jgi:hypothetical protein
MSPDLEKKLYNSFSGLFRGKDKAIHESLISFGCEHDDGWFNIIYGMCETINQHLNNKDISYEFVQIKEKFGTLRVYDNGQDDFIHGVISMAENMSSRTCEVTGKPGKLCKKGHWYRTLCEEEAVKLGYELAN